MVLLLGRKWIGSPPSTQVCHLDGAMTSLHLWIQTWQISIKSATWKKDFCQTHLSLHSEIFHCFIFQYPMISAFFWYVLVGCQTHAPITPWGTAVVLRLSLETTAFSLPWLPILHCFSISFLQSTFTFKHFSQFLLKSQNLDSQVYLHLNGVLGPFGIWKSFWDFFNELLKGSWVEAFPKGKSLLNSKNLD